MTLWGLGSVRNHRRTKAEARCQREFGCSFQQYVGLLAIGREMIAAGRSPYQTPTRAFTTQRNSAKKRGVDWNLTLWQWWCIWEQSGHWNNRGPGQGYVMCRHGDLGAYEPGNVFIATAIQNNSEWYSNKHQSAPRRKSVDA